MAENTIENTRPLLDEIRRRMGEAWEAEPTDIDVDKEWRARGGQSFEADDLLRGRTTVGDVLRTIGHAPSRDEVRAQLQQGREARIQVAKADAEMSMRQHLRSGAWIALARTRTGLSAVKRDLWDGTDADCWLRTGVANGCELRVVCVVESDARATRDHGERKAIDWLKDNWRSRSPADQAKARCLEDARRCIPNLGTEAFKRAWRRVAAENPDWEMSRTGRRH